MESKKQENLSFALRLALPVSLPAALLGTHLTMHHFLVPNRGVAVIRMRCFLLALRLLLPVSVPAALLGTHLVMHDFGVPDCGVAVIRMRWLGRLLRADMRVRISSAEFVLRDTGVTSLALQSVSSAALLWLLRASLEWLKVGIQGHVFLVNSADFLYGYTELACLTICTQGVATNWRLLVRTSRKGRVRRAELLHRYTFIA